MAKAEKRQQLRTRQERVPVRIEAAISIAIDGPIDRIERFPAFRESGWQAGSGAIWSLRFQPVRARSLSSCGLRRS